MGILQKYRVGDRFIAKLVEIEDGGNCRYVLALGKVKAAYSKDELDSMVYLPIWETSEAVETSDKVKEAQEEGFRKGYELAKVHVADALGIEDADTGYERAKRKIMKALETDGE